MISKKKELLGGMRVVVGQKTTDVVGCFSTLMNSLNEVISVTFARRLTPLRMQKLSNPPRPFSIRCYDRKFTQQSTTTEEIFSYA